MGGGDTGAKRGWVPRGRILIGEPKLRLPQEKKLLRNANADRDIVAAFLAISDVSVGADLEFAIDGGVLVDHKGHGLRSSLLHLISGCSGRGSHIQSEGTLVHGSDLAGNRLRLHSLRLAGILFAALVVAGTAESRARRQAGQRGRRQSTIPFSLVKPPGRFF